MCGVHLKTFGMQISIVLTITSGMVGVDENVYNNTVHSQYLKHINYFILKLTICCRVGVKYNTCTWYLYLSTYLSVLDVLEYLVYGNAKVLVLVLVLDQKVLGTYK